MGIGIEIILPAFHLIVAQGVHVFLGEGYYDWASPPVGVYYVAAQIPAERKDQLTVVHYDSDQCVPHEAFDKDAKAFIARTLQAPPLPRSASLVGE
ncbi:hypothetical protein SAMN05518849_12339 [Sphingobium sp. AP50]|uniref:hypothetical protein n=1 Tax=Sphingobium sp. AP50 TaxID=1884369 RepID=UPI0008D6535B|nr:hypothetical protein [Sphingobium sp. AP50]SEJ98751.1 hypothetical protein SAMN05518849_12339 [Sphingobium sp. AP50]